MVVADLYRKDPAVLPSGFSQLFKSGELWGIDQRLLAPHHASGDKHYFPSGAIQSAFVHGLANFLSVAEKRLQLKPPVKIVAGVAFVEGLRLAFSNIDWSDPCIEPAVFHEAIAESFSIDVKSVLRPFFEKLWDACGETYTETR